MGPFIYILFYNIYIYIMNQTNKLAHAIAAYLFEQEFGELRNFSQNEINKIKEVRDILWKKCE